jgi:isochorismate synthase
MTQGEKNPLANAVRNDLPFVVFRLPQKEFYATLAQSDNSLVLQPYREIDDSGGFIMAPFRGVKINHFYCLRPDYYHEVNQGDETTIALLNQLELEEDEELGVYEMTKQEYMDRAEYLVEVLKRGDLRKVVFSRVIDHKLTDAFKPGNLFEGLAHKYKDAFIYLINMPGEGIWVGATPEILLKKESDHAETVAMAGTQDAEAFKWTEKEIKEQHIVMDYIEELLHTHGIHEYGKTGPFTAKAGNVVHLKTQYNLSLEQLQGKEGNLLAGLHPTPAVCGLPRLKSYQLIRKVEKHHRRFYSGFLGPWNLGGYSHLYVNLRCAALMKEKMSLFVGGGYTSESVPEDEWQETIRKSETLLSVVEKS